MTSKWKVVKLLDRSKYPMRVLERLSDPFVASKVKTLYIDLDYSPPRSSPNTNANDANDILTKSSSSQPTFSDVIDGIVQAAPQFRNIHRIDLRCWSLPPLCKPELFRSLWSPMRQNLKVLSLGGDLRTYRIFVESLQPAMPQLDELRILLLNSDDISEGYLEPDVTVVVSHVIPFINSIGPNLKSLAINSPTNVDLSVVFKNLDELPVLRDLSIYLPRFDVSLKDPSELYRFLERQFAVDILTACLKKTRTTIQKLYVKDKVLNSKEFLCLVDAAANYGQLNYLSIHVHRLDWDAFDMLAAKLPRIRRLSIRVETLAIVSSERGPHGTIMPPAASALREYRVYNYLQWKLKLVAL
ncbi:hypothetical protein D9613_007500 [Agrocybe pediades]|uniref:Uncharacterized protein n=1 Tax=Agrocybe pediades TaxID=84607 RepID=A0A8H4QM73_9AGAR|nr:hypothetical protein D9613_007500 [Agrocybe pediades]